MGKPKINKFSQFSFFFSTKSYKSKYILDPEVEPIPNIKFVFGYDHSWGFPPKSCVRGQLLAAIYDRGYYGKWPIFNPPSYFSMDYMIIKIFLFSIKIEGVTVPPHILQNCGCDVTQMSFLNEKMGLANCCSTSNPEWR